MKITKSYLKQVIKEELTSLGEMGSGRIDYAAEADIGEIEDDIKRYLVDESKLEETGRAFAVIASAVKLDAEGDNGSTLELLLDLFREYNQLKAR